MTMICSMKSIIRKQHKVFRSVIILNSVNMMHNFFRSKIASYTCFHNKTVSTNIFTSCVRMVRTINKHISFFIFFLAAFPITISCAIILRKFFTCIMGFVSFFETARVRLHYSFGIFIPRCMTCIVFSKTMTRTILSICVFWIDKFFATIQTFHTYLQLKRAAFGGLSKTVKFSHLLTAQVLGIINPPSISILSISQEGI